MLRATGSFGIESGASPALADPEERGILGHLTAKWDCDTEKLRITVLRFMVFSLSLHLVQHSSFSDCTYTS
ncbi:hypothetical protein AV530_015937 [Patagioenas fasciata monilis]|uniref:Uncharacterized protein n=1 Tax=Patagioenas fasciata monilis TaxID=372326 RepID=A0A1V4KJH6_PATFA|nr:hypothetical protein AV530_015937 [Patagioenas fasciata monilis]